MIYVNYCYMVWMGKELIIIEFWYYDYWYFKCYGYIKMFWKLKFVLFFYVFNFNVINF